MFTYSTPSIEDESISKNNINNEHTTNSDKSANNDHINHDNDEEGVGEDSNSISSSSAIHSSLSYKHVITNTDHNNDLIHKDSPEPVSDDTHKETHEPEDSDTNDDSIESAESVASILVHIVDGHTGNRIHQIKI